MKLLLAVVLGIGTLWGAEVVKVGDRFKNSQSCKACHLHIVKDWEESWHAKSHYQNDEYYRATVDYLSRKTRRSSNGIQVECATCHNPRISVTEAGMDYEIAAVMELDKGSKVNQALQSDVISEGINCVVCHNIDKIHDELDETKRGIHRVEWTPSGVMSGPYEDAKSPYHKVVHRDFMDQNPNQLCLVCHANDRSFEGLVFTDMQSELQDGSQKCVDCHMGEKERGVAATLKIDHGKAKEREIRSHGFKGAHSSEMWRDALNLDVKKAGQEIAVTISNPQPHNIPSGFGARELVLVVEYKQGMKTLKSDTLSLTQSYESKRKKSTIPHLAEKMSKDMSIPANGKRVIKLPAVGGTTSVEVSLFYRLVNDEVRSILELKDPIWSEKKFIASTTLKL